MRDADIFPKIGARAKASVVDAVLIILLAVIVVAIYVLIGHETPIVGLILFMIPLGYEPLLVWKRGITGGHQLMGFRVIDAVSKNKITLGKASLRFLLKEASTCHGRSSAIPQTVVCPTKSSRQGWF